FVFAFFITSPFVAGRLACADDANARALELCVDGDEDALPVRARQEDESLGLRRIREVHAELVVEAARRLGEDHPMFAVRRRGFYWVPGETKLHVAKCNTLATSVPNGSASKRDLHPKLHDAPRRQSEIRRRRHRVPRDIRKQLLPPREHPR